MNLPCDKPRLLELLRQLQRSAEELLNSGLTSASEASSARLGVAFREASRMRLLRLGSTLRVAAEEIARFNRGDDLFSPRRLSFFLNRSWMLSRGMIIALENDDAEQWRALTWSPAGIPIAEVQLITLGVSKRAVPGVFCAFEFRTRVVKEAPGLSVDDALVYSTVFPMKAETEISPEAFLYLTQKQGFRSADLLRKQVVTITDALLIDGAPRRITLTDSSTLTLGETYTDWDRHLQWDAAGAVDRLRRHQPGPFDLEIELQEEIVLSEWDVGPGEPRDHERAIRFPITSLGLRFHAQVAESDTTLRDALTSLQQTYEKPPLLAVMHYEACQLMPQPLALLTESGPTQLGISETAVGAAELVRAMKF